MKNYKFIILLLCLMCLINISCQRTKDSSHIIQKASKAIDENRKEDAIRLLKSISANDKSYQFAQEILYGLVALVGKYRKKRKSVRRDY